MACESQRITAPVAYLMAIIVVVAAALLRWLLIDLIGHDAPYLTVFPAVMLCGVFLGFAPAVLSAVVGAICIEFAFADSALSVSAMIVRSLLVIISAGTVAYLGATLRLPVEAAPKPPAPVAIMPQPPATIAEPKPGPTLQDAIALAEAARGAKERFLSRISHELRTPLTQALAILQTYPDAPMAEQAATDLRRHLQREARLIDDLLDITRLSNAKLNLYLRPVVLHDVIRNTVRTCSDELKQRSAKLTLRLEAEDCMLNGDAARLGQIISNLLSSAVRFSQQPCMITLSTSNVGKRIRITVEGDAPAIEPHAIALIFDALEQGEKIGGPELGSAICKGLVLLHGGSIKADTDGEGKTVRFTVELPLIGQSPLEPGLFA